MILSKPQQDSFWRLWSRVCRDRDWTGAAAEGERKAFLKRCGFASLTQVDRTAGFTRVKNELLVMLGESVQAGLEVGDPLLNKARNFRHVIRTEILPCLALYVPDADAYLRSVIEDQSRWWKVDRPTRDITLDDLDAKPTLGRGRPGPSQLEQVLMTLSQRLNDKRREAGHSLHEMRIAAGVVCDCADCERRRFMAREVVPENCPF